MPVPTVEPTPNIVNWNAPILRLRLLTAPWATGAPGTGRRRHLLDEVRPGAVAGVSWIGPADYEATSANAPANWSTAQSISSAVITGGVRIAASSRGCPWPGHRVVPARDTAVCRCPGGVDVDACPQSGPRTSITPRPISERRRACGCRPSCGAGLKFAAAQNIDHCRPDRCGQRVCRRRLIRVHRDGARQHVAVGHHRRQRNDSAAQRLAQQIDVGHHIPVFARRMYGRCVSSPDWISSAISSTLLRLQICRSRGG